MEENTFTSGPIRPLSSQELGAKRFTDYELLSDSGHNLVYRAQMGGKWVVLKAAKPTEGERTRNQLLLEREFEIMHRLDSIYMVQTISMVDDPQLGRAILMEYIHGRPLDKFIAEKPSYTERRRVADELMEALIFLHERQIVHGDLKPSNILITDSGNHVRLIDFGFADNEAYIAKNIGTSPSISTEEQLPTDALLLERDIYALGKILSLLFPHSVKPIIRHCLASDRSRYTSVRQVRAALHRYWRMKQLLSLILAFAIVVTLAFLFFPHQNLPDQLKNQAEEQYSSLYLLYADSIMNIPEKSFEEAFELSNRYASTMLNYRKELIHTHPQYKNQLSDHYSIIYARDYPQLCELYKDYPFTKSE